MSSPAMSDYLASGLLNAIFQGSAFTFPTNLYIALTTTLAVSSDTGTKLTANTGTGVEVSGGSYARVQLNPSNTNWGAASGSGAETLSNTLAITFTTATGSWGTVVGGAVCDALTNGNMLFYFSLTSPQAISTGTIFQFPTTNLRFELQ